MFAGDFFATKAQRHKVFFQGMFIATNTKILRHEVFHED